MDRRFGYLALIVGIVSMLLSCCLALWSDFLAPVVENYSGHVYAVLVNTQEPVLSLYFLLVSIFYGWPQADHLRRAVEILANCSTSQVNSTRDLIDIIYTGAGEFTQVSATWISTRSDAAAQKFKEWTADAVLKYNDLVGFIATSSMIHFILLTYILMTVIVLYLLWKLHKNRSVVGGKSCDSSVPAPCGGSSSSGCGDMNVNNNNSQEPLVLNHWDSFSPDDDKDMPYEPVEFRVKKPAVHDGSDIVPSYSTAVDYFVKHGRKSNDHNGIMRSSDSVLDADKTQENQTRGSISLNNNEQTISAQLAESTYPVNSDIVPNQLDLNMRSADQYYQAMFPGTWENNITDYTKVQLLVPATSADEPENCQIQPEEENEMYNKSGPLTVTQALYQGQTEGRRDNAPLLPVSSSAAVSVFDPQPKPARSETSSPLKPCLTRGRAAKQAPKYDDNKLVKLPGAVEKGFTYCFHSEWNPHIHRYERLSDLAYGARCMHEFMEERVVAPKRVTFELSKNVTKTFDVNLGLTEENLTDYRIHSDRFDYHGQFLRKRDDFNEWSAPRDLYAV